jgi:hypothetical protein
VGQIAKRHAIPNEERQRFESWLKQALRHWDEAKLAYSKTKTKPTKLKQLEQVAKAARVLEKRLAPAWVLGSMIEYEEFGPPKRRQGAQELVPREIEAVASIAQRVPLMIERIRARQEFDGELAKAGATKPELRILSSHIALCWQDILGRPVTFGENSPFVEFAREIYALAEGSPSASLSLETIRSRVNTAREWLGR